MSFHTTKNITLDELNCTLTELVHVRTGAQVMHISNDDTENVFNLCFRTLPQTSNGVAHILEHTVLCGSKRFPVRDPFFGMTRRSLNTFMNAFTGADFTCYPAASEIPKDFYNLLDVYLDAVFNPLLSRASFLQEGHRLEFEEKLDPTSPLQYKGIVFNEMKGALASGEARLGEYLMEALFPDLTYGINSGGDPACIPSLTYEELLNFHKTFYHPSRCLFFFYGNLPLQTHLDFIEESVLRHVQPCAPLPPLPPLPLQPRFSMPKCVTQRYPLAENPQEKLLIGFGWLTCSVLDQLESLALIILDVILMGTDAGPLKRALLESQLCQSADSLIDQDMSEVPYVLVCKGCKEEAKERLTALIIDTLTTVATTPLAPELIEGAIHQIEMSRTEISGHSAPYGLSLFFRSALLKQHGGQAEEGLQVHTLFAKLRQRISTPGFFGALIRKHLLDNRHFVTVILEPDASLSQQELLEEQKNLEQLKSTLDAVATQHIITQAESLERAQEEEEAYDLLPSMTLQDIPPIGKNYPLVEGCYEKTKLWHHPCFTNEHLYIDWIFDLPAIAPEQLPLLRLFVLLVPQLGCGGRGYKENLDYILQHVAGASLALDLYPQAENPNILRPTLSVRGKSLMRKADKLCTLLHDMLTSVDFREIARIQELLTQHLYELQMNIQSSPLRYAINLAASSFTSGAWINEQWYGLNYFWQLQKLMASFKQNPHILIEALEQMRAYCLGAGHNELVVTCHEREFSALQEAKFYGLLDVEARPAAPWINLHNMETLPSQGRLISAPVAFTAMLFPTTAYTHPDTAALSVASEIMENVTLHKRIREQGGAYGSGATNSVQSGLFYCYSYRDPNWITTLAAFREAIDVICKGDFDDHDLEEAKFGLFQELDTPIAPAGRGLTTYARERGGRTPQRRAQFRHHLRSMTAPQIQEAAQRHLKTHWDRAVLVTFANQEFFDKEHPTLHLKPLPLYSI